ncbi:DUF3040 domain-containing protein [Nucisporomicrobium flavum]|jgi:hypothetical protein|uniref:DUF3040 domain-containing protein n=1 Tax=Nucisporomicrobium flavum TaxID=2785915 RepID=UPI0018F787CE|nr:DUF3040 domain-containing protein [Nucisporomicrobium flavum]
MLSDAEQRRLSEIERDLRVQDPSFAERIGTAAPQPALRRWCGMGAVDWFLAGVVAACLAILLGSGGMAVIALMGFCAGFALWTGNSDGSPR